MGAVCSAGWRWPRGAGSRQGAASADCRVSHQPRLIFTGSLARVANRDANEPAQNLIFTIILLVVGIDSLSHQSRMTIVPLTPFHIYLPMVKACLALYLPVFTVKVLVGAFN